jgi:dolichyl-phosphate beta-glucosyltransferase
VRIHLTHANHGKGFCVRTGMLAASTSYVAYADADGATPASELEKLLAANVDVAVGSRAIAGAHVDGKGGDRTLMSMIFNLGCRALVTPGIYDTQCGFKLFKRDAAYEIFSRQRLFGFAFDVEILYIAMQLGLSVKEIGIDWHDKDGSTVRVFRDAPIMVKDVLGIAWQGYRGLYRNTCAVPTPEC